MDNKPGRASMLTPEVTDKFFEAIRKGARMNMAAAYAGVGYQTIRDWINRAKGTFKNDPEGKYAEFYDEFKRAKAERSLRWLSQLERAAQDHKNFKAVIWLLENCDRENFGKNLYAKPAANTPPSVVNDSLENGVERIAQLLERAGVQRAHATSGDAGASEPEPD